MTTENGAAASSSVWVLIVDDDEHIREKLCELVEMAGCKARAATNGAEALEILADGLPCLIILDLLMPVMTGQELVEAMRKVPSFAEVPIVISTSAPDRAPAGLPVIPKPIDIRRVFEWLSRECRCTAAMKNL